MIKLENASHHCFPLPFLFSKFFLFLRLSHKYAMRYDHTNPVFPMFSAPCVVPTPLCQFYVFIFM